MTDFIINNPITLRGCILYEFTKGNTPFETYKELMKTLGDEFMEYPKFEFWYMRFAQGNFDLDYDFSLETKKRQITDFPVEVFEKVGDSLHFEDRIQLRLVSKDIQFRVDNWDPKVRKFSYNSCNGWEIVQNSETYGFYKATGLLAYFTGRQRNPLAAVVRILKYPKLRLKKLFVTQDAKWMKTEEELRQSSTKLHVNLVVVEYPDYPIDIGLFAPESLERVTVYTNEKSAKKINEIVKPEQCKHLRMFTIEASNSLCEFPNNSFFGYPRFTIGKYSFALESFAI